MGTHPRHHTDYRLRCVTCGREYPPEPCLFLCRSCSAEPRPGRALGGVLEVIYSFSHVNRFAIAEGLQASAERGMRRYLGLLPLESDTSLPPLAILSHRVSVTIDAQLATSKVEQVFQNNTNRVLEATYIFPLPPGATINDFAMYINGERKSGELVEKDKARAVYTEIVRRLRDPGLLEYMGGNLFKLNIFPIPAGAKQKLEIQYSEVLARDSGMHRYVYPLKTEEPASRTGSPG